MKNIHIFKGPYDFDTFIFSTSTELLLSSLAYLPTGFFVVLFNIVILF